MSRVGKDYKAYLKELVKAAGREIINRADDIVGNGDMISDLSLWVRFDQGEVPRIEISREHIIKESLNIIVEETKKMDALVLDIANNATHAPLTIWAVKDMMPESMIHM